MDELTVGNQATGQVNVLKKDGTYHWVNFDGVVESFRDDPKHGRIYYIKLNVPILHYTHWQEYVLHFVTMPWSIRDLKEVAA